MTDFSPSREQKPVTQQFEITVILPRNYQSDILDRMQEEVLNIFEAAEGISSEYGKILAVMGAMKCGLRKQRVIIVTRVLSTATLAQQQQLHTDLAWFFIGFGASKIEITVERIEQ